MPFVLLLFYYVGDNKITLIWVDWLLLSVYSYCPHLVLMSIQMHWIRSKFSFHYLTFSLSIIYLEKQINNIVNKYKAVYKTIFMKGVFLIIIKKNFYVLYAGCCPGTPFPGLEKKQINRKDQCSCNSPQGITYC